MRVPRRECRRRGARGGCRAGPHGGRTANRRPPRRDPLGRRADCDDPGQGPRRAESGIRARARHRTRRSADPSPRSLPIRTAPTAEQARRRTRPAPTWTARPAGGRGNLASIRPRFLPTTTPRASSSAWAAWCARVPHSRTSMTSARSSLTVRWNRREIAEGMMRVGGIRVGVAAGRGMAPADAARVRPPGHRLCHTRGRRLPALQQHRQPDRHRDRLQGCRRLEHRRLVEPAGKKMRNFGERSARRAFLLCLRGRL